MHETSARSPVQELEWRAKLLLQGIERHDALSLDRARARIPHLAEPGIQGLRTEDAMLVIARESGFKDWQMAIDVCEAHLAPGDDYGEFWYSPATTVLLNHWCRDYREAVNIHAKIGGYLIPYMRQFVVGQRKYIEILGMDPEDPSWKSIRCDLAKPADLASFKHLVNMRLKQLEPSLAPIGRHPN